MDERDRNWRLGPSAVENAQQDSCWAGGCDNEDVPGWDERTVC